MDDGRQVFSSAQEEEEEEEEGKMNIINKLQYQLIRKTNYLRYLFNWFYVGNTNYLIEKYIQGSTMMLDWRDRGISYDLILDDIREPYSTSYIKTILTPDDIVIDIGANIGYYALIESQIAKKVYAIEPMKKNIKLLNLNIKLNKRKNIETFNLAIGDKEETKELNVSKHSNLHTFYNRKETISDMKIEGTCEVEMVTLDRFCKTNNIKPNLIRMDVQGYEYNILKGMKNLLKSNVTLMIELHTHIMTKEHSLFVLNTLKENGFEIDRMFKHKKLQQIKFEKEMELNYNLNKLMEDEDILSGKKGGFEIFFRKK